MLQMSVWTLKSSILFLQMGHSFNPLQWDSQEQPQCYDHLATGNGELCSVGMALSHPPACFSMDESTVLLFVESRLLEGLTSNLFSKGVLEFETWAAI